MRESSVSHLRTKAWIESYDSISRAQTSITAAGFAGLSFEAAALPFSIDRTATTRWDRPRVRSCLADSNPRPELAPVTIATLPFKLGDFPGVGTSILTLNWLFQKTLPKFFGRGGISLEATMLGENVIFVAEVRGKLEGVDEAQVSTWFEKSVKPWERQGSRGIYIARLESLSESGVQKLANIRSMR